MEASMSLIWIRKDDVRKGSDRASHSRPISLPEASMIETIHSPSSCSITFGDATDFEAKGRNGFMKTAGVTVMQMPNGEVHLGCITSKGLPSGAVRIPVPKSAVIPLAKALLTMVPAEPEI
jgi:hypothetical protein